MDKDKKIVEGRGSVSRNPEFLILGEAPGRKENEQGEPFVGKAGSVLNYWIKKAKVTSFYISNVVPLLPLNSQGKIRRPTKAEIVYFQPFVHRIIQKVNPKKIIVLGDSAAWALTRKKIKEIIGEVEMIYDRPLTGIYHPARYIRLGKAKTIGSDDFFKAVKILKIK